MNWVQAFILAAGAFGVIAFVLRAERSGWEAIGSALLLGIAGYGMQASPDLPGAPKAAAQQIAGDPESLVKARSTVSNSGIGTTNNWIIVADAFARNGQFANASNVLGSVVAKEPGDGEAWLALANVLVAHADGQLTPASFYAYRKASSVDPDHPGPPFFLGMAMAQTGRFAEAKALWSELLERSAQDAPWREDLEIRMKQLDSFMAGQNSARSGR